MRNNKGFTLVEILAVVVILGILGILAVAAYSKYLESAKYNAYNTLAKSAANAAEEYKMVHFNTETVTIEDLVETQYLENRNDPGDKQNKCTGVVEIINSQNHDGIDTARYEVILRCTSYEKKYCFPKGTIIDLDEDCPEE